jgi:hypothetical protein
VLNRLTGRRLCVALELTIGLLVAPAAAEAANRFAEPGGDGAEPCLSSDPCSIGTAVNAASSGDDVTLLDGVPPDAPYVAASQLSVPAGVTVHGTAGARAEIQSDSNVAVSVPSTAAIRDVTISHTNINGIGLILDGGRADRVYARTDGDWGCELLAGGVIRDSVCFTTTTDPNDGTGVNVFHPAASTANVVMRNVTAVASQPTVPGLRVQPFNAGAVLNVFATNVIAKGGSNPDIATTTSQGQANVTLDHSNYTTISVGSVLHTITAPASGTNQVGDLAFNNAAAGDFRQLVASTGTIDHGVAGVVNGVDLGTSDLDGEARTHGTAPDIGADEGGIPPVPAVDSISPANIADTLTPLIQGSAADADTVLLFDNPGCIAPPVTTGTAAHFNDAGIQVNVAPGTQTTFWAQSVKEVFSSDCSSAGPGPNQTYTVIPTPPMLTATDPPSGSDDNSPSVIGTAREDAETIDIYTEARCTGAVAASGTNAELTGAGIPASVPDNSTTTFYAIGKGVNGDSSCSATGLGYTEVTPSTPPPQPQPQPQAQPQPLPTQPAAKKKCKKRKHRSASVAKKKCKKKKRG